MPDLQRHQLGARVVVAGSNVTRLFRPMTPAGEIPAKAWPTEEKLVAVRLEFSDTEIRLPYTLSLDVLRFLQTVSAHGENTVFGIEEAV